MEGTLFDVVWAGFGMCWGFAGIMVSMERMTLVGFSRGIRGTRILAHPCTSRSSVCSRARTCLQCSLTEVATTEDLVMGTKWADPGEGSARAALAATGPDIARYLLSAPLPFSQVLGGWRVSFGTVSTFPSLLS